MQHHNAYIYIGSLFEIEIIHFHSRIDDFPPFFYSYISFVHVVLAVIIQRTLIALSLFDRKK